MSMEMLAYVYAHSKVETPAARSVLTCLAFHSDAFGAAKLSRSQIARETCLTLRTVEQAIQLLEHAGELTVHRGHGRGHVSRYLIQPLPHPAALREVRTRTRAGVVYLIQAGTYYKIGKSRLKNPHRRWMGLNLPWPGQLLHSITCDDCAEMEAMLHQRFAEKRLHGEWFALNDEDIQAIQAIGA
jgi:Meiotically up-regulated gene 113